MVVVATPNLLQTRRLLHHHHHLLSKHPRQRQLPALARHSTGNVEGMAGLVQRPVLVALARQPTSGTVNACHKL